jgi:hypothetical protein
MNPCQNNVRGRVKISRDSGDFSREFEYEMLLVINTINRQGNQSASSESGTTFGTACKAAKNFSLEPRFARSSRMV